MATHGKGRHQAVHNAIQHQDGTRLGPGWHGQLRPGRPRAKGAAVRRLPPWPGAALAVLPWPGAPLAVLPWPGAALSGVPP